MISIFGSILIPVDYCWMMMEPKRLHTALRIVQIVQMLVRRIVGNCLVCWNLSHHLLPNHRWYLKLNKSVDPARKSDLNFLNLAHRNLPTSICELCPWFSLLVAADVVATAAPRFATSDSAAILSWIGWLKIWLLSAVTNPPSFDCSFDAQIIANIDANSIICFCGSKETNIYG